MTVVVGGLSMLMSNDEEESCLPCTPDEEKRIINEINSRSPLKEGDTYYILSNRWYMEWLKYTGQDGDDHSQLPAPPRPAHIDNHHLVDPATDKYLQILRSSQEGTDYVLVPEPVWKKLYDWYKGGPALPRKVISQGIQNTPSVEVHLLCLQVTRAGDDKTNIIFISKKASLHHLHNEVKKILELEGEKFVIWDYFGKSKSQKFIASNKSLEEAGVMLEHDILVEVENPEVRTSLFETDSTGNGLALAIVEPPLSSVTIAGGPTSSNGDSTGYSSTYYSRNSYVSPVTDIEDRFILGEVTKGDMGGLAGLQNLGNTCFMNSALQCLVHTPPLVEYFMQDYSEEINKENPIGMNGELAFSFGILLRKVWSSRGAAVAPRQFKTKLARFAPQFSGYNQHDSQELLAFLLDGLHEDLNRVKLKPYIELKDANGRPDDEVANECWEIHKARNDSVIVDVCQGQYKSTLVCPVCNKVSVTFDPFMYLTLPLPSKVTRSMTITVFSGNGSALPIPYTVKVLQNGTLKNLIEALSTECCLGSDESLMLVEVYDHRIFKYLENPSELLSQIKDDDYIVAYRLPKMQEEYTKLIIVHQEVQAKKLGVPLVTYLAQGSQSSADIQNAVHRVLLPLLKVKPTHANIKEDDEEEEEKEGNAAALPSDMEIPNAESDDTMEVDHMFNLSASPDDNVYRCRPMNQSDSAFQKLTVDWTEQDLDMYDLSYLENLPTVCKATKKAARRDAISLFSCLEAFLKEEPLGPDDMWFCPSCKEHRQASKKLDLWRLPEILVVHLKRFSYSRWSKNKLDTFVDFPIKNLDLKKYVKSTSAGAVESCYNYELYAVSNHYGGLGGGHYSANAKVDEEKKWYHFDDSRVHPISEEDIKTSAAYVLFYRRVKDSSSQAPISSSSPSSSG